MSEIHAEKAIQSAYQHHLAGRFTEAEQLYREILACRPRDAQALHQLGVLALQAGNHDTAVNLIGKALESDPTIPEAWSNFGAALFAQGQPEDAVAAFSRAVKLRPKYADAHVNLARALKSRGRTVEAIEAYRQALALNPADAVTVGNLANALLEQGNVPEAISCYRRAIELDPGLRDAHVNLGTALLRQGQLVEAIDAINAAIREKPDVAQYHSNLGVALALQGKLSAGESALRHALRLKPDSAEAYVNLAKIFRDQGRHDDAVDACKTALHLKPDSVQAHGNLGIALMDQGRLDEATEALRRAINLDPHFADAPNNLGCALMAGGEVTAALHAYKQAVTIKPDRADFHSNFVYALAFDPQSTPRAALEAAREWNQRHAAPRPFKEWRLDATPPKRLRIGYVSPDFREHCQYLFMLPLLAAHDRRAVEVFCYADVLAPDAVTDRERSLADRWRNIAGVSDEAAADLIRQDQVHVLIDLSLHMARNRLPLFSCKPAPIQVTWLGYPGTTGVAAIDYRLTDPFLDPPGVTDADYSEVSVRLPDTFWCFDPQTQLPVVALPALKSGSITFGSLNNFAKVGPEVLTLWAKVLSGLPRSRLLMLAPPGETRERTARHFAACGIDPDRIEFSPRLSREEYLALYHGIDIGLDPFPYNGHTTSLDAMWMGVPIISLLGKTVVGRAGLSQLSNLGLTELLARDPDEYVQIAIKLGTDLERLSGLRGSLRERMRSSPLMDASGFARNLEAAYRWMWRQRSSGARRPEIVAPPANVLETPVSSAAAPEATVDRAEVLRLANLAIQLGEKGDAHQAAEAYRQVLHLDPCCVPALVNLGNMLVKLGQLDEAGQAFRKAIEIAPSTTSAYVNLGHLHMQRMQFDLAVECYLKTLALEPHRAPILSNLGVALNKLGRHEEAIAAFDASLALDPTSCETLGNKSRAYKEWGKLDEAGVAAARAVNLSPEYANGHQLLGEVLLLQGRPADAVEHFARALQLKPQDATLHHLMGESLAKVHRLEQAAQEFRSALRLGRGYASACNNLGNVLLALGAQHEAVAEYRKAIHLEPSNSAFHSNLLFSLNYVPGVCASTIRHESLAWARIHARRGPAAPHDNNRTPGRALRIGYVSADFKSHACHHFILPLLRSHDRAQFEVACYSEVSRPDETTHCMQRLAHLWRDTVGQSDEEVAQQIREDRIDILVDLKLHTGNNRLLVFAQKPAPVQCTWLGYPGGTGLDSIDYRLTDPYLDPPDTDAHYVEDSVRLPETFWCYDPNCDGPEVGPLPAASSGFVTYVSLNNFAKINDSVLRLWARILSSVPCSRLLLLAPEGSPRTKALEVFASHRIEPTRVEFIDRLPRESYLRLYQRADIALDPLPYNGHTTSLDALWMGVPVVSAIGETAVGRAGFSQLSNLGLSELVAHTPEEYVRIAASLAADTERLASLRLGLRARMRVSPLMDSLRFAGNLEAVYRRIWRKWCESVDGKPAADGSSSGRCTSTQIEPRELEKLGHTGNDLLQKGDFAAAAARFEELIALRPDHIAANVNLGNARAEMGDLDAAAAAFKHAIELDPGVAAAHRGLSNVLQLQGKLDEALPILNRAISLTPDDPTLCSNLILALAHHPGYDAHDIHLQSRRWAKRFADPLVPADPAFTNEPSPERELRVGYVCSYFCRSAEILFALPLLEQHDSRQVEVFCYSDVRSPDELTTRVKRASTGWRSIAGISDEHVARLIRDDKIDILVTLNHHAVNHRLLVMARRPAPVQATWLMAASSTGIAQIDYRLSDRWIDAEECDDEIYSEETLRLPATVACYASLTDEAACNALPALATGVVTFGSMNKLWKLNPEVLKCWIELLSRVPASRLLLVSPAGSQRDDILSRVRNLGGEPSRVEFVSPRRDYLQHYHRVDISLDSFPWGGHATTLNSLWMGVPVVTLAHRRPVGRVGVSVLHNLGHAEWIAQSPEQLVSIAAGLANDLAQLAKLRAGLRRELQESPVMDAPQFARDMEAAYRKMWKTWCNAENQRRSRSISGAGAAQAAAALGNSGVALSRQGRFDEAAEAYVQALQIEPEHAGLRINLGLARMKQWKLDEAGRVFASVLRREPEFAEVHNNLGIVRCHQGRFDEAAASFTRAITLRPEYAEAHTNLANTLMGLKRVVDARSSYLRAIELQPAHPQIRWDYAMHLLVTGDLRQGFKEYEWRLKVPDVSHPQPMSQPLWDGSALEGRTILLHAEQGFGDTIQFARYAPLVAAWGGKVILQTPAELTALLNTLRGDISILRPDEPLPRIDLHCPLMSLPLKFRTTLDDIPSSFPYLFTIPNKAQRWAERLPQQSRARRIGLAWAGRASHKNNRNRSMPARALAPLAALQRVEFVSLQVRTRKEEDSSFPDDLLIHDLTSEINDFSDTAALIVNLDLVLTVDTAVAHLAGALGKPVWVMLPFMPDWRWLLDRKDSPWYPTMRLFRQSRPGNWEDVIQHVVESLNSSGETPTRPQ